MATLFGCAVGVVSNGMDVMFKISLRIREEDWNMMYIHACDRNKETMIISNNPDILQLYHEWYIRRNLSVGTLYYTMHHYWKYHHSLP